MTEVCGSSETAETVPSEFQLQRYCSAFELAPTPMLVTSIDGRVLDVNAAFCKTFWYSREQATSIHVQSLLPTDERRVHDGAFLPLLNGSANCVKLEGEMLRADGWSIAVSCETVLIPSAVNGHAEMLTQISDVGLAREQFRKLSRLAAHDPLTGLLNRRAFKLQMTNALDLLDGDGQVSALLVIDLDRFKSINDSCGHPVGDHVLLEVAKQLVRQVRASDAVARLGGDEFAILMFDCPHDIALRKAQAVADAIFQIQVERHDPDRRVSASVGVASIDQFSPESADPIVRADAAMYRAKLAGGNRVASESQLLIAV